MIDIWPMMCTILAEIGSWGRDRVGGVMSKSHFHWAMLYIRLNYITRRVQSNKKFGPVTSGAGDMAPWWLVGLYI